MSSASSPSPRDYIALALVVGTVALGAVLYIGSGIYMITRIERLDDPAGAYRCYRQRTLDAWRFGEMQCAAVGVHTRNTVNRRDKHDRDQPDQGSTRDRADAAAE